MTLPKQAIKFGSFTVTSQVFYQSKLSFGLVNLKPILPGHVLVCPLRVVQRISDLTDEEVIDFYTAVQKVSKLIEKFYKADALNIAIQDGPAAGQSVPHVHCHIIPRRIQDLPYADQIYTLLNGKQGDLEQSFKTIRDVVRDEQNVLKPIEDDKRIGRSMEKMEAEANELRQFIEKNSH